MMSKTHLVIAMFVVLLFVSHVSNQFLFMLVALIATTLPDIDTGFSTIGRFEETRIVRFLTKHRGFFHSFTFCVLAAIVFAFFIPFISLAFFIGYATHLFADSFTVGGIRPFWPLKNKSVWKIKTGGIAETSIFVVFLLVDILVFLFLVMNVF